MKPVQRAALLVVPAALALSSCGIPATGVVEAGGPASGIAPTTPVYFVRNGTLVAVPRRVPEAGDVRTAVEALLKGPTRQERLKSLTTRLARQPPPPAETPREAVEVTTRGDSLSVELPWYTAELSPLAADQVICTAARSYLLTLWDRESVTVTVTVTGARGRTTEGSGKRCPDL